MFKKICVAAFAATSLVAAGAPAYASDVVDVDVPVYVGTNLMPPGDPASQATRQCVTKTRRGDELNQPQTSHICVYRDRHLIWGYQDLDVPAWGYGHDVYFDLIVYRCRVSDGVCAVVSSIYAHKVTNPKGFTFVETTKSSQTANGYRYKACASMSSSIGFGYGTTCSGWVE